MKNNALCSFQLHLMVFENFVLFRRNFPKEVGTRQKLGLFLYLVDLIRLNLFTSSTSTWTLLMAKLLLKDCMLLFRVKEWEAQAVSNILSVSLLYLFCVSKGAMSIQQSAEAHTREEGGVINWHRPFSWMQKVQRRERARVTVFWRSTDFTVQPVVFSCSVEIQNQNERPEN